MLFLSTILTNFLSPFFLRETKKGPRTQARPTEVLYSALSKPKVGLGKGT
jgi:hypothetical protein